MKFSRQLRRRIHLFLEDHPRVAERVRKLHKPAFWLWKLRVGLRACLASGGLVDPHKTLWVRPDNLVQAIRFGQSGYKKYGDRGKVLGGDWDLHVQPFEEKDVYKAFVTHFSEGKAWEETAYYRRLANEVDRKSMKRGMRTKEDLQGRLAYLDRVFVQMKEHGYKSIAELPNDRNDPSAGDEDEISVRIGRTGALLFEDGRHRLAMAKVLGVERVAVKVTVRHRQWMCFVREVLAYAKEHGGKLYNIILHPDLEDVPALHGMDRFEIVREHLPSAPGRVLDIGCNWGFFCIQLERLGFDCIGVEANERYLYFLEHVREACGCRFEIVGSSIFDYRADGNFDLVLGLYVFHHFLKTESLYDQLVALLGRLKMDRMLFGCHNEDQEGMQGGYRNYRPKEFVEFILKHSCLNKSTHIGTESGRREIYLLET